MRFVMVSPTGVGLVVWVRRAAAAAAEEREALDSRSRTKVLVAARDADALGGLLGACMQRAGQYLEKDADMMEKGEELRAYLLGPLRRGTGATAKHGRKVRCMCLL